MIGYIYRTVEESEDMDVRISMRNEFVDNLLVFNTYAHYQGEVFLSPSYVRYTKKNSITIDWKE